VTASGPNSYPDQVRRKAERMAQSRKHRDTAWRYLANVGVLGWMFILPVVLGAAGGHLLARWTGIRFLAVAGLLLGLGAGAYAAWRQVRRSLEDAEDEAKPGDSSGQGGKP
jgi:ATP synthase protein I